MATASEVDRTPVNQEDRTFLAKCNTCGASKRFHTELGVSGFKLEHYEHDVVVSRPQEAAQQKTEEKVAEPKLVEGRADADVLRGVGKPSVVNLEKLTVRVLPSDTEESMHFEVRGLAAEGGFSMSFPLARARDVRDFVRKDSCVITKDGRTQEFKWGQGLVRADSEVSSLLGLRIEEVQGGVLTQGGKAEQSEKVSEEVAPAVSEPTDSSRQRVVSSAAAIEKPEMLLVASSFYLQEGEAVQKEALRISSALKELRWGVEPPYVISIMIDDNIGIEANGSAIMTDLAGKIEPLGYKFVAMNAPNGKPTAWFKRKEAGAQDDAGSLKTESRERIDAIRRAETLAKQLEEERGKLAKEAAWEARSSSLLSQIREIGSKLEEERSKLAQEKTAWEARSSSLLSQIREIGSKLEEERSKLAQEKTAWEARSSSLLDQLGEIESASGGKRKEAQDG